MNDVSGGDENLILARIAERMAGEGDGEDRYLASIARFLKLRSGAGGKAKGRVFSWTMKTFQNSRKINGIRVQVDN